MNMLASFTSAELAAEAEREVKMREHVFANRVAAGKMRQADADRKIRMMEEIARRLRAQSETEAAKRSHEAIGDRQ